MKSSKVSKLNVIFMQNLNIFPNSVSPIIKKHLKRIFDLKGSTVERFTKKIQEVNKFTALKDLDFIWMINVDNNVNQY